MVRDINPDGNSSSPLELKELNGRLYFSPMMVFPDMKCGRVMVRSRGPKYIWI